MKKRNYFSSFICIVLVSLMVINAMPLWAMANSENELTKNTNIESVTPVVVCEDVTKRGEFEKHFICSDDTVKAVVYNVPIHYMSENGTWEDIDNSLIYDNLNESYSNKLNPSFDVSFLKDGAVRLKNVSWKTTVSSEKIKIDSKIESIVPEVQSQKKIEGADANLNDTFELPKLSSSLTYANKKDKKYDISYALFQGSVKENLTMYNNEVSGIKSELYTDSKEYIINNDDTISFVDSDGEILFTVYPPIVFDADYSMCDKIGIDIVKNTEGYSIEYSVDEKWLSDEERSFPVSVQRIVSSYNYATSNYINMVGYQRTGSGNYSVSSSTFGVGHNYSSGTHTFYSSFLSIKRYPNINTDLNTVTDISVVLNKKDAEGLTVIKTYKLTSDDFEGGALKTSVLNSGFSGRSTFKNYTFAYSADKFELKLDPQDYDYNNPGSSYGYVLTSTEKTSTTSKSYAIFYSSNDNSVLKLPSITVTYSAKNLDGKFVYLKNNSNYITRMANDSVGLITGKLTKSDLVSSIWKFVKYDNYYRIVLGADTSKCLKVTSSNTLGVGPVILDPYSFDELWDISFMTDSGVPKLWISNVKNGLNICNVGGITLQTPSSDVPTALWEVENLYLENDWISKLGTLKNESLSMYLSYENSPSKISTRECVMAANCSWNFKCLSSSNGSYNFLIKFSSRSDDYSSKDNQCLYYDTNSNPLNLAAVNENGSIASKYIWNISLLGVDVAFGDVWQYKISISNAQTGNYLKMNSAKQLCFGSKDDSAVWVSSGFQTFRFPLDVSKPIRTAKWGYRDYPKQNLPNRFHYGVDFSGSHDVYAMADGIVIYSEYADGYGNRIIIYHPDSGYCTVYQHLKSMENKALIGNTVVKGQKIGVSGKTGGNYKDHLHFEIWNYFDYKGRKSEEGKTVTWNIDHPDVKNSINPLEEYNDTDFRMFNSYADPNREYELFEKNGKYAYTYKNPNPVFFEIDGEYVYNEKFCYSYDNDSFYTANKRNNSGIDDAAWHGKFTEAELIAMDIY